MTDIFARALASELYPYLKQPIVIDNQPGATQVIGVKSALRAPADGQTLLMGSVTNLAINVWTQKHLPYDPIKDLAPVGMLFTSPQFLVVRSSLRVESVRDLVALAKARPGEITYASIGVGSSAHLAGELFKSLAGIDIRHIPYKGTSQAITDIAAGRVDMLFTGGGLSYVEGDRDRLRILATTSTTRSAAAPGIPTMQEAGVPGYEASLWFSLMAPAGTPAAIVEKINHAVNLVLGSQSFKQKTDTLGVDVTPSTPNQLAERIQAEIPKWGAVITRLPGGGN
ncbi:tripartite tricarboxylate transporter substrate-binding protein [Pigmentiphaga sp. CHJ604]|uniref:Bug family tripartite tricarboxylate transporter substrate binding protein n=1 Tax=Pigmentiphaga sp. CHJ604 TaxID=3081984 RepID=UPI0030D1A513